MESIGLLYLKMRINIFIVKNTISLNDLPKVVGWKSSQSIAFARIAAADASTDSEEEAEDDASSDRIAQSESKFLSRDWRGHC